ncbi:MAG: pseudouridine synthase [Candidatus Latescibacterota bacterium]
MSEQAGAAAPAAEGMRLNRFLARAGVASRRQADALIASGAVAVNGQVVADKGRVVRPRVDRVTCQGVAAQLPAALEYIAFHKPVDSLVTRRDPGGRTTVFDHLPQRHAGTVAVGRLDRDTTGLLLLTDDGELAYRLMHPRFEVDKRYAAWVVGRPSAAALGHLRRGMELDDGPTAPAEVKVLGTRQTACGPETQLALCIHEGRKRQVRRMLRAVGHPVRSLARTAFAGIELDLPDPGQWRYLTAAEVRSLRGRVGLEDAGPP